MPKSGRLISRQNLKISSMNNGFQLMELLIVLTIVSLLISFSIPIYSQLFCHEHRLEAEFALTKLAIAMEHYHLEHDSYQGASLSSLGIDNDVAGHEYRLEITRADERGYLLSAVGMKGDRMTLNELGVKS